MGINSSSNGQTAQVSETLLSPVAFHWCFAVQLIGQMFSFPLTDLFQLLMFPVFLESSWGAHSGNKQTLNAGLIKAQAFSRYREVVYSV